MIEQIIWSFIYTFFENFTMIFFIDRFTQHNPLKKCILRCLIISLMLTVFYVAVFYVYNPMGLIKILASLAMFFFISNLVFKANWAQGLFVSALGFSLMLGTDYFIGSITHILVYDVTGRSGLNPLLLVVPAAIGKTLFVVITLLLQPSKKNPMNAQSIEKKEWLILSCFPMITLAAITVFDGVLGAGSTPYSYIGITAVFCTIAPIVVILMRRIMQREQNRSEALLMRQQADSELANFASMRSLYENQRKLHHDYMNQLRGIGGLISTGEIKQAAITIEEITGQFSSEAYVIHTNNSIVDTIVNQKYLYAQEHGISITITANDLSDLPIANIDLIVVLSNVLDNAIEACMEVRGKNVIRLKIQRDEHELIIATKNPTAKDFFCADGADGLISTKIYTENHGIGLKNVEDVVSRYGGTSAVKYTDGKFHFSALIPI